MLYTVKPKHLLYNFTWWYVPIHCLCLEKQGDAEGASIVCEAALKEKLDDPHQVDCQLMRLRYAKSKGNEADVAQITQSLRKLPLTEEQQKVLGKSHVKKLEVAAPAKTLQPKVPAKVASTTMPDKPKAPTLTPAIPLAPKISEPAPAAE